MVHFISYVDKYTLLEKGNDDIKSKHFWIYGPLFRNRRSKEALQN